MVERDERFRTVLENRSDVLNHLIADPASKPELVDSLDTSRSTVDRAIRDLVEVGFVAERGSEYVATAVGRIAFESYDDYRTEIRSVEETREFLESLPPDVPFDVDVLTGATAAVSEAHAPERVLNPSIELLQEAETMKGLAPTVLTLYPDVIESRVREGDLVVEIVAERSVLETLPDLPSTRVESLVTHDAVTLYEAADSLPYALWLMDTPAREYAGITAYDDGGVAGMLVNDAERAVRWARTQYADYRDAARLVRSPTF